MIEDEGTVLSSDRGLLVTGSGAGVADEEGRAAGLSLDGVSSEEETSLT